MKTWKAFGACVAAAIGSGCASLPNAEVNYYLPRVSAVVSVERHVTCRDDSLELRQSALVEPTYSADMKLGPRQLDLAQLNRWYAGSELSVTFSGDGRLLSINSVSQGDGEAWAKAAAATAGLALQLGVVPNMVSPLLKDMSPAAPEPEDVQARRLLCARAKNTKDGVASYPYEARLEFGETLWEDGRAVWSINEAAAFPLMYDLESSRAYRALEILMGAPQVRAKPTDHALPANRISTCANGTAGCASTPRIHARMPVPFTVELIDETSSRQIGIVSVPQAGHHYELPLPSPRLFGKQTAQLSFASDGSIASIGYSSGGAATGIAAGGTALMDNGVDTASKRAARTKAQADEIASQARLSRCRANPEACQ